MGLFSFFRKKDPGLKPQRMERPGINLRLKPQKKSYTATVALVLGDKPLRQFTVTDKGYSRDIVAAKIEKELSLKLIKVVQDKPRRENPHKQSKI